jgi:rhodanese-related sulfurtransferase
VEPSARRRKTIHDLLAEARARLERLPAEEAYAAMRRGVPLVDVRGVEQRRDQGVIPGSLWFPRNVLEWRVDPASSDVHPALGRPAAPLVLLCAEGYQSSLAAANLQELGFAAATDVVDGFAGWVAAGLPVELFDPGRDLREGMRG